MTCNQRFNQLLDEWWKSDSHADRDALARQAMDEFSQYRTVLALDMSGFSRHTRQHGPMPFLALIRQMRAFMADLIRDHDGQVVKFNADNCMAHFQNPNDAVSAARQIVDTIAGPHFDHAAAPAVKVALGIATGPIFVLSNDQPATVTDSIETGDIFGDAVNQAFRLGEDIARAGEILLSDDTAKLLSGRIQATRIVRDYNSEPVTAHLLD